MPRDRRHQKCHPRTIREFQERLTELKNWMSQPGPPAEFRDEWFAGLCAEPSHFTRQLISLRDALQEAGQKPEGEPEPVRVRKNREVAGL
jgi:hypothetical protein